MPPNVVLELLNSGRGVPLNDPSRHHELRAYYLLFAACDSRWYIAVARASWRIDSPGVVLTVLTQQQFEHDRGTISTELLSSAARQAPGSSTGPMKTVTTADDTLIRRHDVKVVMTGWDRDYTPTRVVLGTPPLPHNRLTVAQVIEAFNSPSLWPWLQQRTRTLQIDSRFRVDRLEVNACGIVLKSLETACRGPSAKAEASAFTPTNISVT